MSQRDKPRQGVVANSLNLQRSGAVGFIDWLDVIVLMGRMELPCRPQTAQYKEGHIRIQIGASNNVSNGICVGQRFCLGSVTKSLNTNSKSTFKAPNGAVYYMFELNVRCGLGPCLVR